MIDRHAGGSAPSVMHELLLDSPDITAFLTQFTQKMATTLAADGEEVWCAVTLLRERRSATVASSNDRAAALDEIQYVYGDGPCLTAAREHVVVHVPEVATDDRWPGYTEAAAAAGVASVLGVPFELAGEARAALNIYADQPHAYDQAKIEAARQEVALASSALRLAVRLAGHRDKEADLQAAMASRTSIDLAVGIVMGQNRCTQQKAFEILKAASNHRNVKLRDLAAELVASVGKGPAATHFEN
ncbi:GAF and ANTAR domain-containing protein [Kocuria rosea]|jgi:GAF domain-containing protein|uniref:GAF and ANTAR domain-containing protein n=1 Tax=Kocuria rosea TaxID=1275 RepID=UPI00203D6937|nr:GAF and ANTAR domain-containing protein [Kocuria rosea]MCM3687327.1 GAF and ANTAR domain-containing protein [Kocuria rosea]HST71072.1 GAF and ANTAR domain-containing protein [Kocuria rosea]